MAIEFTIAGRKFTIKDIITVILLLGFLVAAVSWFLATKESNKVVPILQTTIGEMKIDILGKTKDIEEHTEALDGLTESVESIEEIQDVININLILLMRDQGVEPVESPLR